MHEQQDRTYRASWGRESAAVARAWRGRMRTGRRRVTLHRPKGAKRWGETPNPKPRTKNPAIHGFNSAATNNTWSSLPTYAVCIYIKKISRRLHSLCTILLLSRCLLSKIRYREIHTYHFVYVKATAPFRSRQPDFFPHTLFLRNHSESLNSGQSVPKKCH